MCILSNFFYPWRTATENVSWYKVSSGLAFCPLTDKVLQVLEGGNFEEPRVLQVIMMDLFYL